MCRRFRMRALAVCNIEKATVWNPVNRFARCWCQTVRNNGVRFCTVQVECVCGVRGARNMKNRNFWNFEVFKRPQCVFVCVDCSIPWSYFVGEDPRLPNLCLNFAKSVEKYGRIRNLCKQRKWVPGGYLWVELGADGLLLVHVGPRSHFRSPKVNLSKFIFMPNCLAFPMV